MMERPCFLHTSSLVFLILWSRERSSFSFLPVMFLSAAHITKWLWICPLSTWVEQTKAYLFSKVRSINSRPILWASSGVTSSVGMQWSYALLWWRDMGMLQLWLHWRVLKESCKWKFQFWPLLWVLNLIGNNAFRRGVHLNPLLNTPNGTIVKIVSFSLS